MKTFTRNLSAMLLFALLTACSQTSYFENPVIGKDVPDPTIIRDGDTFYAAGTSGNAAPVYPIFESTDLVNWTPVGHIFNDWPDWTLGSFWAPELFQHNGKTYCYYTARKKSDRTSCVGVAVADSPTSKFTDYGPLVEWTNEAIDSYVFDDDGQLYIIWKAYGLESRPIELLAQRLSDDGIHLEGEAFSLLRDDEGIGMEGQCVFKKGGYYYLLYAVRDCCSPKSDYEVYVARAKSFAGPYEKYTGNPILKGDGQYIQSCGHGTLVETQHGHLYYLCHSYLAGRYNEGRQPILQELVIGKDRWPHFKTGNITKNPQPKPKL